MMAATRRMAALAAALVLAGGGVSAEPAARDPWLQPFSARSLWNTSLGTGARWSKATDADTIDLRHPGPAINAGIWSMPYFLGTRKDARLVFRDTDPDHPIPLERLHAPDDIHAASPAGGDRHIILFDPSRRWMFHYLACERSAAGFDCGYGHKDDACSDGGLDGYAWGIGVMRRWEIEAGTIRHMLRYSLPQARTLSGGTRATGQAWPADAEDYNGPTEYSGRVLYGSTIGLPGDVDIDALNLTPSGRVLAKALRDYGALQRDTGGFNGLTLYAEESAEGMPQLDEMRRDLPKILPHLAILRNQTPATPNGPGPRRQPPAPPLDPTVCGNRGSR